MVRALAAALFIGAPLSAACAQPNMNDFEFKPPVIEPIPSMGRLMLPGDRDPIPDASAQDIALTLRVTRRGDKDRKSGLISANGQDYWRSNVETTWAYGPYDLEARLRANGKTQPSTGRAAILAALAHWQKSRDHYLKVLESYGAATLSGNDIPPRRPYYGKISADVRRVLETAKHAKQDVDFLASLLQRQRAYLLGTQRYGPNDERSPLTAKVTFAGAKATERTQTTRTYFGKIDGQADDTAVRTVEANNFSVTPGVAAYEGFTPGVANAYTFVPNITLEILDLAGCEADQLSIIVAGLDKRLAGLSLKETATFDFTPQEAGWHSETTLPVLTRMFRETYQQAVYEAVRYAWVFSGKAMPQDMQLGTASARAQDILWHPPYEDPRAPGLWVDASGAPIIRDGAALHLPPGLDGRHLRLLIAEAGGTPPTDLGYLTSYAGFTSRTIKKQLSPGVQHSLLTWRRSNFEDSRINLDEGDAGRRLGSFDLKALEPAWRGSYTGSMQRDSRLLGGNWNSPAHTRIFSAAGQAIDPAEVASDFSKAPRMHLLQGVNLEGTLEAKLWLRYTRDASRAESYDIDRGVQDVEIDIKVTSATGAPPLQVCPEPVFDKPPQLRLVQFWENDRDKPSDDAYLPAEKVWPGHPYFVEAKFEEAPQQDIYRVNVGGARAIRVTRTSGDAALYRSDIVTFAPEGEQQ